MPCIIGFKKPLLYASPGLSNPFIRVSFDYVSVRSILHFISVICAYGNSTSFSYLLFYSAHGWRRKIGEGYVMECSKCIYSMPFDKGTSVCSWCKFQCIWPHRNQGHILALSAFTRIIGSKISRDANARAIKTLSGFVSELLILSQ